MDQRAYHEWIIATAKPGDILLSINKKNLFSQAIAEVTNSQWSHSFLYIGGRRVIESTVNAKANGVQINPLEHYLNDTYVVGLFRYKDLTNEEATAVVEAAKRRLGVKYSAWQILYDFIQIVFGASQRKHWVWDDKEGVVCSELIALCFGDIQKEIQSGIVPSVFRPSDIASSKHIVRLLPNEMATTVV